MPLYLYKCPECELGFEVSKPISEYARDEKCPTCGQIATRKYVAVPAHWGFTLTEASHHNGNEDELTSRRPSNEGLVRQ